MPKKPEVKKAAPAKKAVPTKTAKSPGASDAEKKRKLELIQQAAKKNNMVVLNWRPQDLAGFAQGRLTLAQLQGVTQHQLNDMAEVGYSLLSQGKLDDARTMFLGLATLNPYDAYYPLALGSIEQRANNLKAAEDHYTRAIGINASIAVAYVNRGEIRIMLGRLGDAIGDFIRAVALSADQPNDPAALRARATLTVLQEQLAAAKKATQKSVG
jgi:tetratricopeptide (TPR) repeat protein